MGKLSNAMISPKLITDVVDTDSKYFYGDEGRVECHKGKILAILATFGLFWLLLGCFGYFWVVFGQT